MVKLRMELTMARSFIRADWVVTNAILAILLVFDISHGELTPMAGSTW